MTDLDVALHLIIEARAEMDRYINFQRELDLAKNWTEKNKVYQKYETSPTKAIINDNLKIARRLLKKSYM